jgi:AcrR family transcriptional regulator
VTTYNVTMMVSPRQTAAERKVAVLAAAITEFARSGYAGTSTETIAARAGISQLFRLFGTKKDLFVATYRQVGGRIVRDMTRAANGLEGEEAMQAMGAAYLEMMADPELLQVQMHGFAAATGDADIAAACRETFDVLWHFVKETTKLDDQMVRQFFSEGMMISVMSAIDLLSVSDHWAQSICPVPEKMATLMAATHALHSSRVSPTES